MPGADHEQYSNMPSWRWDDDAKAREAREGDDRFVFDASTIGGAVALQRLSPDGALVWEHPLERTGENEGVLVVHEGRLYAALYARQATGCRVLALDAATGLLVWETALQGVGPVLHSKYHNQVQMHMQRAGLVIYGKESAGNYVEVLDPSHGQQIAHQVIS